MTPPIAGSLKREQGAALDLCFRSGMSSKSDLRGAIEAGVSVGVVALALTPHQTLLTLPNYLNRGVGKIFIDSGAFSTASVFGPSEWDRILRVYEGGRGHDDAPRAAPCRGARPGG